MLHRVKLEKLRGILLAQINSTYRCEVRKTDDGNAADRISSWKDEICVATEHEERRGGILARVTRRE